MSLLLRIAVKKWHGVAHFPLSFTQSTVVTAQLHKTLVKQCTTPQRTSTTCPACQTHPSGPTKKLPCSPVAIPTHSCLSHMNMTQNSNITPAMSPTHVLLQTAARPSHFCLYVTPNWNVFFSFGMLYTPQRPVSGTTAVLKRKGCVTPQGYLAVAFNKCGVRINKVARTRSLCQ